MKAAGGMRGMARAVATAVALGMAPMNPGKTANSIMDRAPMFRGLWPKRRGLRKSRSKYKYHQGEQECARRVRQAANSTHGVYVSTWSRGVVPTA